MQHRILLIIISLFTALEISAQNKWTTYSNKNHVLSFAFENNKVWLGTNGGVICVDTSGAIIAEYNNADGMPDNSVNDITIDDLGNKWFGTDEGVCRFNGTQWTMHKEFFDQKNASISSTYKDSQSNIWFGSSNIKGVTKFNGVDWTNYNMSNSGLPSDRIYDITQDAQGNMWFATWGGGICKYDGNTWTTFNRTNSGIAEDQVRTIVIDAGGTIWAGTYSSGVSKYDGTTWTTYNKSNSGLGSNYVYSFSVDAQGIKWVGTLSGVFRFDGTTWTTFNASNSGLADNSVVSIAIDNKGKKWFGTGKGFSRFDNTNWKSGPIRNWISSGGPKTIIEDSKGNKWFALYFGGVCKFDGTTWTNYNTANSGLSNIKVTSMAIDAQDVLWIGTEGGGVCQFDGINWTTYTAAYQGLTHNYVNAIAIDREGNKWIGTIGGLCKFDGTNWTNYNHTNSGISQSYIRCLAVDGYDNIWIGTGDGLNKFDGTNWTAYHEANSGLINCEIETICIDDQDNKWIGTSGGVSKFDGIVWTQYKTTNSGLPYYFVHEINVDADGTVWIGTSLEGATKFDGTNWITYNEDNSALAGNNVEAILVDKQGNKWFGSSSGTSKFEDGGAGPVKLNNYKPIYGSVFNDGNGNSIQDMGEALLPYKYVMVVNDSSLATTQENGLFCILRTPGKYQIRLMPCKFWEFTTDSIINIEITDATKQLTDVNFGIRMLNQVNDVSVDLTGNTSRAGFNTKYWVTYRNEGTQSVNGTVSLEIDSLVEFVSSTPAPSFQNGRVLTWNYTDLVSLELDQIYLFLKMPDVSHLGETLELKAIINPTATDISPANDTSVLKQVLVGSYDPNDKSVDAGTGITEGSFSDKELTYTIRFQNMGTDTAFNVVIRDTLSNKLNIETFRFVASSHDVEVDIKNKNVVSFIFKDINLPDDKNNEPASHGFVKYAIKPVGNLPENTEVKNTAYIYFDFNPAIATNEVKSTYASGKQKYMEVSKNALQINAMPGTSTFEITSNTSWNLDIDQAWLTVNTISGYNNTTIFVNAATNPSASARTATITVSGNGTPSRTIFVTQAGTVVTLPELKLSSADLFIGAPANSTGTFDIQSNIQWTLFVNQPWLKANINSGSGNETILLTAQLNPTTSTRRAEVRVSGTGFATRTIVVTQEAAEPYLNVTSNYMMFTADTLNEQTLNIVSNIPWSASVNQNWINIIQSIRSDSDTITLTLTTDPNPTINNRTGTIIVSGAGVTSQMITITQNGAQPMLTVSPGELAMTDAASCTQTVEITSTINWNITCNQQWLTLSRVSGSGNGSLIITAQSNPIMETRTAIVTISGAGVDPQNIIITQNGGITGISDFKNSNIIVYPNPARNFINIENLLNETEAYNLKILNSLGQIVLERNIVVSHFCTIDLLGYPNGIYLVTLQNDMKHIIKKIIIQKSE